MEKYHPIDCNYYDELEALATKKSTIAIEYKNPDGDWQTVQSVIVDFFIRDKVEYLQLKDGTEIRLDYLRSVDGKLPPEGQCRI